MMARGMTKKLPRELLALYLHVVHGWQFSVHNVWNLEEIARQRRWKWRWDWSLDVLSQSEAFVQEADGISWVCVRCMGVGFACVC